MNIMIRILVTLISGVSTFCCVFWFAIPMSFLLHHPFWVSYLGSGLVAALMAWDVWMLTASFRASLARSALLGALVGGTIGFSVGFLGPTLMAGAGASVASIFWSIILGAVGLIFGAVGVVAHWYAREGPAGSTGNWPKTGAG